MKELEELKHIRLNTLRAITFIKKKTFQDFKEEIDKEGIRVMLVFK